MHVHRIGSDVCVLRLSKPIKAQYAKVFQKLRKGGSYCCLLTQDHNLDIERLMDSSAYKETYRHDMIMWSEAIRKSDPGYFCRLATSESTGPVWLICDARRESDMHFFKEHHGAHLLTVRVQASKQSREDRGWVYNKEVDDSPSECGLDHYNCDVIINNTTSCEPQLTMQLQEVISWVKLMTSL